MSAAGTKAGGEPALGIIGGSGLYEMEGIEDLHPATAAATGSRPPRSTTARISTG